jgi:D-alanyl-lipoteichoic acid acyltransferase DltB (MBOAT superfamily)
VLLIAAIGAACAVGRARGVAGIPPHFWPVLGSVFVFRLIVWLYDLKHAKAAAPLHDDLAYFFLLPNWGCLLFPVVDWHTMRKSFLARDVHDVAQTGVRWMARGVVQLLVYDWIYYHKPIADPGEIDSAWKLLAFVVSTYLLYLRVSGSFHFVVGVLHLFGYDLPETNRRWALASSITDFWRRINIYWKDFMVKVVYFPVYFRLRRRGDVAAQGIATALVFAVTWALHAWQTFWLDGYFLLRATDVAFWSALGALMVVNQLLELRKRSRGPARAAATAPRSLVLHVLKVAGTFLLLATLWSMWNARSFSQWIDLLTFWRVGP